MKLFGDILPFIGFDTLDVAKDGHPIDEHPYNHYEADCFVISWLGVGIVLFTKLPIRKKQ